jgi:hypothetical protein
MVRVDPLRVSGPGHFMRDGRILLDEAAPMLGKIDGPAFFSGPLSRVATSE